MDIGTGTVLCIGNNNGCLRRNNNIRKDISAYVRLTLGVLILLVIYLYYRGSRCFQIKKGNAVLAIFLHAPIEINIFWFYFTCIPFYPSTFGGFAHFIHCSFACVRT